LDEQCRRERLCRERGNEKQDREYPTHLRHGAPRI
jgi:hypothetical protein